MLPLFLSVLNIYHGTTPFPVFFHRSRGTKIYVPQIWNIYARLPITSLIIVWKWICVFKTECALSQDSVSLPLFNCIWIFTCIERIILIMKITKLISYGQEFRSTTLIFLWSIFLPRFYYKAIITVHIIWYMNIKSIINFQIT